MFSFWLLFIGKSTINDGGYISFYFSIEKKPPSKTDCTMTDADCSGDYLYDHVKFSVSFTFQINHGNRRVWQHQSVLTPWSVKMVYVNVMIKVTGISTLVRQVSTLFF